MQKCIISSTTKYLNNAKRYYSWATPSKSLSSPIIFLSGRRRSGLTLLRLICFTSHPVHQSGSFFSERLLLARHIHSHSPPSSFIPPCKTQTHPTHTHSQTHTESTSTSFFTSLAERNKTCDRAEINMR